MNPGSSLVGSGMFGTPVSSSDIEIGASGASIYEEKSRPRRDIWAMAIFLVVALTATCTSFAAFAGINKQTATGLYTEGFWYESLNTPQFHLSHSARSCRQNSSSCDLQTYKSYITPTTNNTWVEDKSFGTRFIVSFSIAAPLSIVAGLALSLLYLFLFIRYAQKMVVASIIFSLTVTLIICIATFVVGAWPAGLILLLCLLISAGVFWWIRSELPLCAKFLSTATQGLVSCHGIIYAAIVLKITGVLILAFYLSALIAGSYNGSVISNPSRAGGMVKPSLPGSDVSVCYDSNLQQIPCCSLSSPSWISFHYFMASVMLIWGAYVILELRLYITADTIAQWYFSLTPGAVQPSTMRAVKHGLTSSFGSIALGAAILAIIDVLREAMKRRAQEAKGWMVIVCCILNCLAQCLLSIIEQFTRFVTIATAITGKAFIPAGRDLFSMMTRILLPTAALWWIPGFVLSTTVNLIALSWAAIVFFLTWGAMASTGDGLTLAFAIGGVALFFCGFVLNFTASILIDCTNTIYIAFCYDRDNKVVTRPVIHEVYMQLPAIRDSGMVVQNPGGEVAYGAPQQQQGHYSQPPQQQMQPPAYGLVPGYAMEPPPPPYGYVQQSPAPPPPPYQPYSNTNKQ